MVRVGEGVDVNVRVGVGVEVGVSVKVTVGVIDMVGVLVGLRVNVGLLRVWVGFGLDVLIGLGDATLTVGDDVRMSSIGAPASISLQALRKRLTVRMKKAAAYSLLMLNSSMGITDCTVSRTTAGIIPSRNAMIKAYLLELTEKIRSLRPNPGEDLALLAITLLGMGVRAFFMAQPMRLDEAYTFLYYLNTGRDPFYYNVPNNHVFHTLLAKLAVLLGGMDPVVIRMPAFIAGVLCIPVMYFVAKSFNPKAGLLAALGMALFPYMVLYSTMARGYSLIVLFTLLLILLGRFYLEKPSLAGCGMIALISALGLYTIPTMIFPLAGLYLWLTLALLAKFRNLGALLHNFLFPTLSFTAVLTVFFYAPVLLSPTSAARLFSNEYVNPKPWSEFLNRIAPHLRQILTDFFRDVPTVAKYVSFLLASLGAFAALRRRDWAGVLLIPSIVVGALVIFFAKQAIPFVRTWIYLLPFILLFADLGYSFVVERLRPTPKLALTILMLVAGLFYAGIIVNNNAIAKYADTGSFPEAQVVAKYLKPMLTGDEFIAVMDTANFPLYYYLCTEQAPTQKPDLDPKTVKRYFVVQNSWYPLTNLTKQPAEKIFAYGDADVYTSISPEEPIWPGFVFDCTK